MENTIDLTSSSHDEIMAFIANKDQLLQYDEIKLPYALLKEEIDLSPLADNHCLFCNDGEVLVDSRPSYLPIVKRKSFVVDDKLKFRGVFSDTDLDDEMDRDSWCCNQADYDACSFLDQNDCETGYVIVCNNWYAYEEKCLEKIFSDGQYSEEIVPFWYYGLCGIYDWNYYVIPYPIDAESLAKTLFDDDDDCENDFSEFTDIANPILNKYNDLTIVEVPYGTTRIEASAFENCINLLAVVLPPTVEVIEDRAFSHCYNLQSINFPQSLKQIGKEAFSFCHCLRHITIPSGVKSVGDGAFNKMYIERLEWNSSIALSPEVFHDDFFYESECCRIKHLILPSRINDDVIAFRGGQRSCLGKFTNQIGAIYRKDKNGELREPAFMFKPFLVPAGNKKYASDGKALFTKSMKTLVAIDPSLEEYTIPEGVTAIEEYAFYGSAIKSIDIPEAVTKIGNNAFEYCRKLKKVSFKGKKGIAKIPENCFRSCHSLQTLSLPSGVRTIDRCAFSASGLKTFTMPKSVTVVKDGAFKETSLERMILKRQLTEFGTLWKDLSQKKCEIIAQSKGARKTLRQIRRKRLCSKIKECANNCVDKIKDLVNDNFCIIELLAIVGVIVGVIFGIKALYGVLPHLLASFLIIIVLVVIDVIALKGKDLIYDLIAHPLDSCWTGCCVTTLDVFVILMAIICGSELLWPCICFFFWKVYLIHDSL